jgi:hypothetical protein
MAWPAPISNDRSPTRDGAIEGTPVGDLAEQQSAIIETAQEIPVPHLTVYVLLY